MHGKKEKTFLETCLSVLAQRNDLQKWKEDNIVSYGQRWFVDINDVLVNKKNVWRARILG
jgi:hypothetical protein